MWQQPKSITLGDASLKVPVVDDDGSNNSSFSGGGEMNEECDHVREVDKKTTHSTQLTGKNRFSSLGTIDERVTASSVGHLDLGWDGGDASDGRFDRNMVTTAVSEMEVQKPEIIEEALDKVVTVGNVPDEASPIKPLTKTSRKSKEKEVAKGNPTSSDAITSVAALSESELRILRKKERRNKQTRLLKPSLPSR
jgi:hypothetical protein